MRKVQSAGQKNLGLASKTRVRDAVAARHTPAWWVELGRHLGYFGCRPGAVSKPLPPICIHLDVTILMTHQDSRMVTQENGFERTHCNDS